MSFPAKKKVYQDLRHYVMGDSIGTGNFTEVYTCVEKVSGKSFGIKEVNKEKVEKLKKERDVVMEKHVLMRLRHPNILKLHNTFRDGVNVYIVFELCVGDMWKDIFRTGLPESIVRFYFAQVLNGIEYMHTVGIVHRDLKAENLMVQAPNVVKIIDFGSAKDHRNPHVRGAGNANSRRTFTEYVGTPNFMAPEMIRNKFSDFRADLWSLGCTLYQLLDGLPPFTARSEYLIYIRAMRRDLELPVASAEAVDLIDKLVVPGPDGRLGARTGGIKALKAHPFFEGYDFPNAHRKPKPVMSLADCCLRAIGQRYKVCLEHLPDEDDRYEFFTDAWVAAHDELSPHIKARLKRIKRNVVLEHKMHPEEGHEEDDEDRALVDNMQNGEFGADDDDDEPALSENDEEEMFTRDS